jgi:phosphatidate cytidylyltransferase
MLKRTLSTLALWTIVVLTIKFAGPTGSIWMLTLIGALTLREFYALIEKMGLDPFDKFGIASGIVIMLSPLYVEPFLPLDAGLLLALVVIIFSIRILGERDSRSRVETLGWSLFGVLYVPYMLHFLVRIILLKSPGDYTGMTLGVWLIAVSKFCDVGALLSGLAFGRHRMAPVISPKKTWEGAIGGILISAGVGAAIAWGFPQYLPARFTPLAAGLVALPIASLAIVSDLVESIIKRRADIKDAGATIPGIGGIFDLSDSLILTAPLGYAILRLF